MHSGLCDINVYRKGTDSCMEEVAGSKIATRWLQVCLKRSFYRLEWLFLDEKKMKIMACLSGSLLLKVTSLK